MAKKSLQRQRLKLADAAFQVEVLNQPIDGAAIGFAQELSRRRLPPLESAGLDVLQVNFGKLCNQACCHCHVDAGPDRRESMTREIMQHCLDALDKSDISTVDITGGAPEMNPHFRWFVSEVRRRGLGAIDRCNLTILLAPGYRDLPEFLAEHKVEIVASLPCYLEENADAQRGAGTFARSIKALRKLNSLGYGSRAGLGLTLVFNPLGPKLPPLQPKLEETYRRELRVRYGIEFTRLYTITNMPISRFLAELLASGEYKKYMHTLAEAFNPAAVAGVMCRRTLSVDWQGRLYDCDFNQMLELGLSAGLPQHISEFDAEALANRSIKTGPHCLGCTAGAGSSCQGAILSP